MLSPRDQANAPAVLHVVPRLEPGERTRAVLDLGRALKGHGWRSGIATASASSRELALAGEGVVLLPLEAGGMLRPWRNAQALARAVRQQGAVAVHAHGLAVAGIAESAARRAGVPLLLSLDAADEPGSRREPLPGDLVLAGSEHMAEALVEGGMAPERLRVVPPWIDMTDFDPEHVRGQRVAATAERFGLGVGPKVVAVPTEVAVGHGRALLAEALAKVPHDDYVLLLLGPLPGGKDEAEPLLRALRGAGIEDRVRFATSCADLPAALMLIDLLLVPATRPPASMRLVSAAQAMGKPAILTNIGALPELIMPAVTGWLLPPDAPSEIAWAIDLAFRMSDDVLARVARRARGFVAEDFGGTQVLGRVLALYESLAGQGAQRVQLAKAG